MATPPAMQKCIQIILTNRCENQCSDCSQFCPHLDKEKLFDISLEDFEKAVATLENLPGHVGLFGGNPLLHPQFDKICEIFKKYVFIKARRELWCSGGNWDKWKSVINDCFYPELVSYNEHKDSMNVVCYHQPTHVAAEEVFTGAVTGSPGEDLQLMWKLIDNCWVNNRWSSIISPMGAYPCEVMAARATVLGGPKGLPVEKDWWKRPLSDWQYQINELCPKCGMCLPVPQGEKDNQNCDTVSPRWLLDLKKAGSPRIKKDQYKLYDVTELQAYYKEHTFTPCTEYRKRGCYEEFPDWRPYAYRPVLQNAPEIIEAKHEAKKS